MATETQPSNRNYDPHVSAYGKWARQLSGEAPLSREAPHDNLEQPETSPTAALLRRATERIANVANTLDNRAATREERRTARTETLVHAKETVYAIGRTARRTTKEVAYTSVALTFIAAEAASQGIANTRDKLVAAGTSAKERFQQRRAERRQDSAYDSYSENIATTAQREAYESYEDNIQTTAEREAAERKANQEAAYDTYADNIDTTQRRENQEAAFASYEENIDYSAMLETAREINARAEAARARKEARRERWDERIGKVREKGGDFWKFIKSKSRSVGRSALRVMRRGRAAARGARQGWKQSA